jgi:ppGpp synthetase/RelA/SpoT-type nucleotidyltranferase
VSADLLRLREDFLTVQPIYERLARYVADVAKVESRKRGLPCTISGRVKDVGSFLKKTLRKAYQDPFTEITDKAGVRLTTTYADVVPRLEDMVRETFTVTHEEDKRQSLGFAELGYRGTHFDVALPDVLLAGREEFRDRNCEIQVHTRAENLWADISHEVLYKPAQEPPPAIGRRVYRLVALVEIFDGEIQDARKALWAEAGFQEAAMLAELEGHFYRFTGQPFDRELSLAVLGALKAVYSADELARYSVLLEDFVASQEAKISHIFEAYAADESAAQLLVYQPESLAVFERLETVPNQVKTAWANVLPIELLDELAAIWGIQI